MALLAVGATTESTQERRCGRAVKEYFHCGRCRK